MHQFSNSTMSQIASLAGKLPQSGQLGPHLQDMIALQEEFKELVEHELPSWLEQMPASTKQVSGYLIKAGGKRLRPVLSMLASSACGGTPKNAIPVAIAVEFLHSGTLLHDDVVDDGDKRRNQPTANKVWSNALAVLSGDYCFFTALSSLLAFRDFPLLEHAMQVARELCEGELMQLENRGRFAIQDENRYFEVIDKKTAALFAFATEGGARSANASEITQKALREYGRLIGLAFQIIDDVLDFSGDPLILGKNLGQDLSAGIITLPIQYAIQSDRALCTEIESIIYDNTQDEKRLAARTATVVKAVQQCNAVGRCREKAQALGNQAIDCLHAIPLQNIPESRYRTALEAVALAAANRSY